MSQLTAKQKLVLLLVVSGDQNRKPFVHSPRRADVLARLKRLGLAWSTCDDKLVRRWHPTDLGRNAYDELMAPEAP